MKAFRHLGETLLALCLAGMVIAVFGNVVLRYGFNSGINASEELSRLLFVWMVFLGATLASPAWWACCAAARAASPSPRW
jgi:TRAP-type transport system small permease protein